MFSPELWRDAAPCNLPSVGARRATCPAFLCLPTATHESFSHSCSRWMEMSPRWQSVLCVCVHLCSCHIRECFYCTSGLSHIPEVMRGRLLQDGGAMCGCSLLYVNACPQSSWTCDYHARSLDYPFCEKTNHIGPKDSSRENFTTLQLTNCQRCSAYVLCHAGSIQLKGY